MLAERTEGLELHTAEGRRADIYFFTFVTRACKMLIESGEGTKKSVTKVALERVSVLQVLSRIIIKTGICDDVFLIVLQDVTVDGGKVNLGTTTTRLEMEDQGRTRDKGFVTIPKRTRNISGTMSGRSEMLQGSIQVCKLEHARNSLTV
jgi:hypothetical protein